VKRGGEICRVVKKRGRGDWGKGAGGISLGAAEGSSIGMRLVRKEGERRGKKERKAPSRRPPHAEISNGALQKEKEGRKGEDQKNWWHGGPRRGISDARTSHGKKCGRGGLVRRKETHKFQLKNNRDEIEEKEEPRSDANVVRQKRLKEGD